MPFPGSGGGQEGEPVRITRGGAHSPLWAPDMSELYYRVGSAVWAVEIVDAGEPFQVGDSEELFDGPYAWGPIDVDYDVHPTDGSFVMTKYGRWPGRMIMIRNFSAELERLVPN